jgi:hypothetical protein
MGRPEAHEGLGSYKKASDQCKACDASKLETKNSKHKKSKTSGTNRDEARRSDQVGKHLSNDYS